MIRTSTPEVYQEYQIATSSSVPSTGQLLAYNTPNERQSVILEARGDTCYVAFGGSAVAASKTVTSNALPAGNFSITSGAIIQVDMPSGNASNYISVLGAAGSGTLVVKLCNNNI